MRYHFDVRTARGIIEDPEGAIFASDQESIEAARSEALGIAADCLRDAATVSAQSVIIRDGSGRTVAELDISSVVKGFLK